MNSFLKGEMFGMPRWVWFALLGVGVAGGLYWRAHSAAKAAADAQDPNAATDAANEDLSYGYDPSQDPSLAGQGMYGGSGGGGNYPYQTDSAAAVWQKLISGILEGRTKEERAQAKELKRLEREIKKLERQQGHHGGNGHGGPGHHKPGHHHRRHHHPQGGGHRQNKGRSAETTPTGGGPPSVGPYARLPLRG